MEFLPFGKFELEHYRSIVAEFGRGRIYLQDYYLSALSDKGWGVYYFQEQEVYCPVVYGTLLANQVSMPPFCQQLGLVGRYLDVSLANAVTGAMAKKYASIVYSFNAECAPQPLESLHYRTRMNYVLGFNNAVDGTEQFNSSTKRHIEKNRAFVELQWHSSLSNLQLQFYLANMPIKLSSYEQASLINVCKALFSLSKLQVVCAYCDGELCGLLLFALEGERITYFGGAVNARGRKLTVMAVAFEALLKRYGDTYQLLDFEGSDIPGVAEFYSGFGAVPETYVSVYSHNYNSPISKLRRFIAR